MAEDPTLSDDEQTIVRALHRAAATERAPARLRERIQSERERSSSPSRSGLRIPALRSVGARAWSGAAAVFAAAVVAVVLLLTGASATPSVAAVAAVGTKAPTAAAPEIVAGNRYLLAAKVGSIHFPNWEAEHQGWSAVGSRMDRVGNRDVTTVFYGHGRRQIAYSIVSSPRIFAGYRRTVTLNGRTVYLWTERGHSCVLSAGSGVSGAKLRSLVASSVARTLAG